MLDFRAFRAGGPAGCAGRAAFAAELRVACTTSGFFYLANTGLPGGLAEEALAAARGFFALPLDVRRSIDIGDSPHFRGATPRLAVGETVILLTPPLFPY